ncbi:MAG: ABC transporter substrate-binding protein [Hyphomicrobiaceae bacterium]|nr:ABC transporter substrate-binding protein [Hyphomicrobiaceae bacterium]
MSTGLGVLRSAGLRWQPRFVAAGLSALCARVVAFVCVASVAAIPEPAVAADPAVKFMAQVGRELMAAARTRSPDVIASVIQRYGDVSYIGLYSLGSYRSQLSTADRVTYYGGMVRFISRYAATEAPKYPIARVEWVDESIRGANGVMVDCKIVLDNGGGEYEVRWLLAKYGDSYKVRDAMVVGFWMTPFLKQLFEDYIAQNGGNPRALVAALNR